MYSLTRVGQGGREGFRRGTGSPLRHGAIAQGLPPIHICSTECVSLRGESLPINAQRLIDQWSRVSRLFSSSPWLFQRQLEIDRQLAEIALLSGRRETWEVFVLVMAYSQEMHSDPNEVLRRIEFDKVWALFRPGSIANLEDQFEFFRFCFHFKISTLDRFVAAVYIVSIVLAQSTLKTQPAALECIQECVEISDDDSNRLQQCIREHCVG